MSGPLTGAFLKVERARQHLKLLNAEIAAFAAKDSYRVAANFEGEPAEIVIRMYFRDKPASIPLRLSLIAGDAVHNLRSALDHLAYALAQIGTGPTRHTQFPIFEDAKQFRDNQDRFLAGIVKRHRARIEALQPYHARPGFLESVKPDSQHPLASNLFLLAIRRLDNMDKHRLLISPTPVARFQKPELGGVVSAKGTYVNELVRMEDGAEIYRVTEWEMLPGETTVKVKRNPTYSILFGNLDFGPLGSENDIWSDDNKGAVTAADLWIAAEMVEGIIVSFNSEFPES